MDLSNLSTNLPLSTKPTEEAFDAINKELSDEFKVGARSIAALYRLSNTKNSLLIAKGYLNSINDISNLLDNGNISSLDDLRQFLHTKKLELSPNESLNESTTTTINNQERQISSSPSPSVPSNNTSSSSQLPQSQSLQIIGQHHDFTINNPTNHHFPLSRTPMSIDNTHLKYYHSKSKSNKLNSSTITSSNQCNISAENTNSNNLINMNINNHQSIDSNSNKHLDNSSDDNVENNDDNDDFDDISFDTMSDTSFLKRKLNNVSTISKKQKFNQ